MTSQENQHRYAEHVLARLREWQDVQNRIRARHHTPPTEARLIAASEYTEEITEPHKGPPALGEGVSQSQ